MISASRLVLLILCIDLLAFASMDAISMPTTNSTTRPFEQFVYANGTFKNGTAQNMVQLSAGSNVITTFIAGLASPVIAIQSSINLFTYLYNIITAPVQLAHSLGFEDILLLDLLLYGIFSLGLVIALASYVRGFNI